MELFKSRTRVAYTNAVGDKVYPVVVDIKKGIKSTEDIQFVSSDVNTGILSVAFISGNENFNVSGADVVCSVMRPDASTLELPCEVVRDNIVEVPLGINGTSQDGVYSFDFKVLKGGNKIVGTPIMNYSVSLSIGNDMVIEEDDRLPVLTMLITQVNELKEETRETVNQANVATEASREATANAIEATNNANAVSERVSQETATAISEIKRDTANAIASMNQSTSTAISNMNQSTNDAIASMNQSATDAVTNMTQKTDEALANMNQNTANAIADMTQKTNEAVTMINNNLANVNNVVTTKVAELDTAKSDMTTTVSNKVNEVETRFNALTSSQQQDAEVIDARDGEISLKARLDRDIEKAKQVYVNVEGSHISTDSSVGYAKDVEILGNTIQSASNLADIRSVGDTVEGQELYEIPVLSCGKNLINIPKHFEKDMKWKIGNISYLIDYVELKPNTDYTFTGKYTKSINETGHGGIGLYLLNSIPMAEDKWYVSQTPRRVIHEYEVPNHTIKKSFNSDEYKYFAVYLGIATGNEHNHIATLDNAQLEEGTQATPYEPYVEDKLTILSPVQLEKVRDVADRIICKDGVWGVEKNIKTKNIDTNIFSSRDLNNENYIRWYTPKSGEFMDCIYNTEINGYCDKYEVVSDLASQRLDKLCICILGSESIYRLMLITPSEIDTVAKLNDYVSSNPFLVKYPTTQPTFIPLPYDQQIKLRTFANKTNISFLTEIEGTIKAQVPKSLGATVNTHTEQINNLNKELDRVKKLEESTVSTVTTESDFTTVEATSNGYFEDVKLEGKTLVNLCTRIYDQKHDSVIDNGSALNYTKHPHYAQCDFKLLQNLKQNTTYTVFLNVTNFVEDMRLQLNFYKYNEWVVCSNTEYIRNKGVHTILLTTNENIADHIRIGKMNNEVENLDEYVTLSKDIIVLEGDYTQNPPSYFEGLKSASDGVDEIVVSSVNENLWNDVLSSEGSDRTVNKNPIKFHSGCTYTLSFHGLSTLLGSNSIQIFLMEHRGYPYPVDGNSKGVVQVISNWNNKDSYTFTVPRSGKFYIQTRGCQGIMKSFTDISLSVGVTGTHTPHQSDKKRLLYYNEETQAWEKPILREWDSIEKHADGKYYYHQRSGEVVLNGSEDWKRGGWTNDSRLELYGIDLGLSCVQDLGMCDKLKVMPWSNNISSDYIDCVTIGNNALSLFINSSKLTSNDLTGGLKWLQANNVTVVYQLAQEKVYECINIDLITYSGETNFIVNSGVITPRTTLKVHNNISNVVSLLQKKVSLLEDKFIQGLKQVLAGDMYSLAELLYPEDFVSEEESSDVPTLLI